MQTSLKILQCNKLSLQIGTKRVDTNSWYIFHKY